MPKWTKQDYVDGLNQFFSSVDLKIDWSKLTLKDLEAFSDVLQDEGKVATLFGMDHQVSDQAGGQKQAAVNENPLFGGLLQGGLMDGEFRERVGRVMDEGIDGLAAGLKKEKPLRSQIGSGRLFGRLLHMGD